MRRDSGFTLIELMVTLSVLAILVSVGVPSMQDFIRNNRRAAAVNQLVSDIQRARSTAATQGVHVVMCHSVNGSSCTGATDPDWAQGWIVFVDDDDDATLEGTDNNGQLDAGEQRLSVAAERDRPRMPSTGSSFRFSPGIRSLTGAAGSINVCIDGSADDRRIAISVTGRPRLENVTCT